MRKIILFMLLLPIVLLPQIMNEGSYLKTNNIFLEEGRPKNVIDSISSKDFLISAGFGIRYQPYNISEYYNSKKTYSTRPIINLGFGAYLDNRQKNILGIELFAYQYPEPDELLYPNNLSFVIDVFYRINIRIADKLVLYPQIAVSPFSSVKLIYSGSVSVGLSYDIGKYEIYANNNFRYSNQYELTPWFFNLGFAIKL